MTRQRERDERQAGRRQRDEQRCRAPTGASPRSRPCRCPSAAWRGPATTAPMNDDDAADAGDEPEHGRLRAAGRRARTGTRSRRRCPTAPRAASARRANARRTGSCARAGRPRGSRRGPARGPRRGGGGASSRADRPEQHRRDEERDRVDARSRSGAVSTWTRKPLIPNARNSGGRPARRQRRVRLDQPLALDDRRQVGVVGRVEERRQDGGQPGDEQRAASTSARRARTRPGSSRAAPPARGRPR